MRARIETDAAHRTATYTNLPPGDYRFHGKAANADGVWDEAGTSVALAMLPPGWRIWWAHLIYGLVLVGGLFSMDRFQRGTLLRKERERNERLEEERRELVRLVKLRTAELKQRVEELSVINSVQRGLVAELDMQAIYDLVGDRIRELFDAQVVVIRTFDHDDGVEHFRYAIEKGKRLYPSTRPIDAFIRHLIDRRSPLLINEGFVEYLQPYTEKVVTEGEVPQSALFVPMIVGDTVRGDVSLQNVDREHAFTESDVRLLSTLTNSMSVALENARLFDETTRLLTETEQRNAELAVINSVQEGLVAELEMQAIYDLVGERIRELFDAQVLVIATIDTGAGLEHHRYNIEKGERRSPEPRPLDLLRKRLIDERTVIHIEQDFTEALIEMGYERPEPVPGTRMPKTVLFVPLVVGEEVRGYVSLQNVDREHAFSESDVRLLTTLTNSMSVALENARLFDETRQQAIELETVNRVSRALVAQLEFDALVRLVGEQMRETFQADIVYLALLDREDDMISFPYAFGDDLAPIAYGEGLTSQIIRTQQPLLINQDLHGRHEEMGIEQIGKQAASYLGVPILAGDEALGVISVQSTESENRFDEDDLRLLSTIAANVGVALGNAEAYRTLEKTLGELKSTQQQLVQQEKLASLGQLTAGIAHEIKNPLNFITGFAEVNEELAEELHQELAKYPEALRQVDDLIVDLKQNAGVIKQHGRRADAIVRSMMAHARTGSGEREVVSFNDLIDEHVELAYHGKRAQVPGFPAEIERDYGDDVGDVELVPQEIGRVVLNLVTNAFDAVADHAADQNGQYVPQVKVSTRRTGGEVELRVEDNGPGITEAVRDRIFEPFFTTKASGSGTGLGLSMSYDIVTQSHGGILEVEQAANGGAAFVVRLPARKGSAAKI